MNEFEKEKEDRQRRAPMTRSEFAHLGDGEVAYIRQLDTDAAERLFPALSDAPTGIDLFAVLGAGTFRRKQKKHDIDLLGIDRLEIDRLGEAGEYPGDAL